VGDNSQQFWSQIRSHFKTGSTNLPTTIDDAVGPLEIVEKWKEHYEKVFNLNNMHNNPDLLHAFSQSGAHEPCVIEVAEIVNAVKCLKPHKSAGIDNLQTENIIHSSHRLYVLLAICFSQMFNHSYFPEYLGKVIIIPLLKDKSGDLTSTDNYRPIALVTVLSKVLERVIIYRCTDYLYTSDHQFGFKKFHSTDQCVFILKGTIDYYIRSDGPVFTCFLDASKAFDRVNHVKLFQKLIERHTPLYIVKLLSAWYSTQHYCIRWGGLLSDEFAVTNGVRQGGILSPALFNVYIHDLDKKLSDQGIGCHINGLCVNHLIYADDLCLLSPSIKGLQKLINICIYIKGPT